MPIEDILPGDITSRDFTQVFACKINLILFINALFYLLSEVSKSGRCACGDYYYFYECQPANYPIDQDIFHKIMLKQSAKQIKKYMKYGSYHLTGSIVIVCNS